MDNTDNVQLGESPAGVTTPFVGGEEAARISLEQYSPLQFESSDDHTKEGSGSISTERSGEFAPDTATASFEDVMSEGCFLGEYSLETIVRCIRAQFDDYVNLEDTLDYVDVFYRQLEYSYEDIKLDSEDHPMEKKAIINNIRDGFIEMVATLFKSRLGITIAGLEENSLDQEEIEGMVRLVYESFILNARENFIHVISNYVLEQSSTADKEQIYLLIDNHNPYIKMTIEEYLERIENHSDELLELFNNLSLVGNFIAKYTPRLYDNEELSSDIFHEVISKQLDSPA